jgi:hypothetical protein
MKFLENDLEEIIYTSGRDVLEERGLLIEGELRRQVKIGNYGIADLVSISRPTYDWDRTGKKSIFIDGIITIYELKKEQIGIAAFLQALTYAKGIKSYLEKRGKENLFQINIVLIGRNVDTTGGFCYLPSLCKLDNWAIDNSGTIQFYQYNYSIDGLRFVRRNDYDLTNKGF